MWVITIVRYQWFVLVVVVVLVLIGLGICVVTDRKKQRSQAALAGLAALVLSAVFTSACIMLKFSSGLVTIGQALCVILTIAAYVGTLYYRQRIMNEGPEREAKRSQRANAVANRERSPRTVQSDSVHKTGTASFAQAIQSKAADLKNTLPSKADKPKQERKQSPTIKSETRPVVGKSKNSSEQKKSSRKATNDIKGSSSSAKIADKKNNSKKNERTKSAEPKKTETKNSSTSVKQLDARQVEAGLLNQDWDSQTQQRSRNERQKATSLPTDSRDINEALQGMIDKNVQRGTEVTGGNYPGKSRSPRVKNSSAPQNTGAKSSSDRRYEEYRSKAYSAAQEGGYGEAARLFENTAYWAKTAEQELEARFNAIECYVNAGNIVEAKNIAAELSNEVSKLSQPQVMKIRDVLEMS